MKYKFTSIIWMLRLTNKRQYTIVERDYYIVACTMLFCFILFKIQQLV